MSSPAHLQKIPAPTPAAARRAVTAAVVGNVLEWYDFAVYSFLAGVIGSTFFPSDDPSAELLASFDSGAQTA